MFQEVKYAGNWNTKIEQRYAIFYEEMSHNN